MCIRSRDTVPIQYPWVPHQKNPCACTNTPPSPMLNLILYTKKATTNVDWVCANIFSKEVGMWEISSFKQSCNKAVNTSSNFPPLFT